MVEKLAKEMIALDRTSIDVGHAFPGGVERRFEHHYRVGDYLESIDIVDEEWSDSPAFKIVFHVRDGVSSYWKDAVVEIIRAMENAGAGVKTVMVRP